MVEKLDPLSDMFGLVPSLEGARFTGVYGKWNYMDGLGAFMGVAHDLTGDVWIYKPMSAVPELDIYGMMLVGLGMIGWCARRVKHLE